MLGVRRSGPRRARTAVSVKLLPSVDWLRLYPRSWFRPDFTAGLTTAAVVVPKAMAFATIAGLPLHIGLYTAIVPMAVYALLGTSRPLSVSTTTTIAILTAAQLARSAPGGDPAALIVAAATLSVLVGVLLTLGSLLRLGFIANFISDPVLTGFKSGIGLVIVVDQLPKLLGVHFEKAGFFRDLIALAQQLPETSIPTLAPRRRVAGAAGGARALRAESARAARRDRDGDRRVRGCWACRRWASPRSARWPAGCRP